MTTFHLTSRDEATTADVTRLDDGSESGTGAFDVTLGEDTRSCVAHWSGPRLHMMVGQRSVTADIRPSGGGYDVAIGGRVIHVGVLSDVEMRRQKLGHTGLADDATVIESPMAGRVVKVLVSPGDTVSEGESLMIIEAMKMENEIKSGRPGVIEAIDVTDGDTVEVGVSLVRFVVEES